ncbi:MAG: FecR family protein [Prolixibacteraceae bacterium]|nr:FecR family protein [Prolixibacteraceae bacterium]
MKNTDDILQVVMGYLKGDSKKAVLSQLEEDLSAREEFRKVKNARALISSTQKMPEYQLENLYLDFKRQLDKKQKRFRLNGYDLLKYAAVFILAAGLSSLFFYSRFQSLNHHESALHYTSVFADNGQISKMVLPDSTVVWLNSDSKVTYNSDFAVNNREINLSGQAFFKVTKNEKIPLKVFCNNLEVKVLGTMFDVSAYPNDKNISVVLESGKVEVQDSKKSFHYELEPGEMVQYTRSSGKIYKEKVKPEKFISWKDGVLIFRDDPMNEVLAKLRRRYNIDIEVTQPDIYKSVFTATIKNETLDEIFRSIGFACSVRYQIIRGENLKTKTKVILTSQ